MVNFLTVLVIAGQVGLGALSADDYIAQFPWRVSVGTPHVWPGMEKGQVACFDEGGLLQQVLVAAGLAPTVADDPDGEIFDYFLETGRQLKDLSGGTILNLLLPTALLGLFNLGVRSAAPATLAAPLNFTEARRIENRRIWDDIQDRAQAKAREHDRHVLASGRALIPLERNLFELQSIFEEALNDTYLGEGFTALFKTYITAEEPPKSDERIQPLSVEPGQIPPPEVDINIWRAYTGVHRILLKTRAMAQIMNSMVITERRPSLLSGYWLRVFSQRGNLGTTVCGAIDIALDEEDPQFAEGLRCALETAFISMMACGGAPMQCSSQVSRNHRDYSECDRPSAADETVTIAQQAVAPLKLLPRKEVDGQIVNNEPVDAILEQEIETYMYSWRGVQAGGQWTLNGTCKWDPSVNDDGYLHLIPGWRIAYDMWMRPEGTTTLKPGTSEAYPFAQLARNVEDECRLLLINRGTATEWEWFTDVDAKLEMFPMERHVEMDLKAHRGMQILLNAHWPGLRQYLSEEVLSKCASVDMHVTGHSLGGGIGMLWAVKLADFLEPFLRTDVNTVLFAPLRPLSVDTVEQVIKLPINLRSFAMSLDMVPSMPCAGGRGMQLCNTRTAPGMTGAGIVEEYGNPWNEVKLSDEYMAALHENNYYYLDRMFLHLGVKVLPSQVLSPAFSLPASLNAGATHSCSLDCFTSALGCSTVEARWSGCDYSNSHPCDGSDDFLSDLPQNFLTGARCHVPTVTRPCAM